MSILAGYQVDFRTLFRFLLSLAIIFAAASVFGTKKTQSAVWTGPYYSAAANFAPDKGMQIDLAEVRHFANLEPDEQEVYRFRSSDALIPYRYNDIGFVYIILAAKALFPFLGDQMAVRALQMLMHALLSTILLFRFQGAMQRSIFFIGYAINPFVIHFATFPYCYFWQVVPAFAFLLVDPDRREFVRIESAGRGLAVLAFGILIGFVILARPTTVLLASLVLVAALLRIRPTWPVIAGVCLTLLMLTVLHQPTQRNPWFTAYVGLGAYPNSVGISRLSDEEGYALYQRKTGVPLDASLGGNFYDPEVMDKARHLMRNEYLSIISRQPALFARNAAVNTLQAYSIGYINGANTIVHYAVAGSGLLFGLALLYSRQWWAFVGLGLASGGFTLYYPPIPAYMYGAYIILVFSGIRILERISVAGVVNIWLQRRSPPWLKRVRSALS